MKKMEHRRQVGDIEHRDISNGVEIRSADGKTTLRGYAARFGIVYDMGWFTEEVHRDAFKNADMSDVRVLQDHNPSLILGRTKAKTARVGVDENGFWYEVDLPNSPNGENMRIAAERGDIDQSSWGFTLRSDKWETRDGKQHRTLIEIHTVFDASPVTFPANPDTSVAKRSFDLLTEKEQEKIKAAKQAETINTEIELALLERRVRQHLT